MSPLAGPPEGLLGFPRKVLRAGLALYRIHLHDEGVWWFGNDGAGRFDLTGDPRRGTCYLAEAPLGAFIEVFREPGFVDEADMRERRMSKVSLPARAILGDCTSRRARAFGITGAIHSDEDYGLTRMWARALAGAGFDGIRYLVSHDPRQRLAGVALFGPAGSPRWRAGRAEPIPTAVIRDAERLFGIRVVPAP